MILGCFYLVKLFCLKKGLKPEQLKYRMTINFFCEKSNNICKNSLIKCQNSECTEEEYNCVSTQQF